MGDDKTLPTPPNRDQYAKQTMKMLDGYMGRNSPRIGWQTILADNLSDMIMPKVRQRNKRTATSPRVFCCSRDQVHGYGFILICSDRALPRAIVCVPFRDNQTMLMLNASHIVGRGNAPTYETPGQQANPERVPSLGRRNSDRPANPLTSPITSASTSPWNPCEGCRSTHRWQPACHPDSFHPTQSHALPVAPALTQMISLPFPANHRSQE
jgi:hypothetical protein